MVRQICAASGNLESTVLQKHDAEQIHADQQRETANSNREIDLMHCDLPENGAIQCL